MESAELLLAVLEEHSPGMLHGLIRAAHLCRGAARAMGLPAEQVERIALAARLHDIGKVAVPERILLKPGKLTAAEWELMRTHTEVGERILASAPSLSDLAGLVRSHHERFDGSGYPDGLSGEEIPLGGRIMAVADAFEAMMRARPYSDAVTVAEALQELRRCAGTQFDPAAVEAVCDQFDERGELR
jgi:two-component system cell cycle response regulator